MEQDSKDDLSIEPAPLPVAADNGEGIFFQENQLPHVSSALSQSNRGRKDELACKRTLRFYMMVLSLYVCDFFYRLFSAIKNIC